MTIRRCSSCNRIRVDANQDGTKCHDCRRAGTKFPPSISVVDQRYAASLAYVIEQMP